MVVGGNKHITPLGKRKPIQDLIIYELMIDDFTCEFRGTGAPLAAIESKLSHLQSLGVNAIEFMPWTAWPGYGFSWGYYTFQYFSVEYGYINDPSTPADKLYYLKHLIDECLLSDLQAHLTSKSITNFALILEHLSDPRYSAIDVVNRVNANSCWYQRMLELSKDYMYGPLTPEIMRICAFEFGQRAPGVPVQRERDRRGRW